MVIPPSNAGSTVINCCCDPCAGIVAAGQPVLVSISGVSICSCSQLNFGIDISTSINGAYSVPFVISSGAWILVISGGVTIDVYGPPDCSGPIIETDTFDLTITVGCTGGSWNVLVNDTNGDEYFSGVSESISGPIINFITPCGGSDVGTITATGGTATVST